MEWAKVFDTYETSYRLEAVIKELPEGYIVAAACKDECVSSMSSKVKNWFEGMGSEKITNLNYREGFAFVGISGRQQMNENKSADTSKTVQAIQVFNKSSGYGSLSPPTFEVLRLGKPKY